METVVEISGGSLGDAKLIVGQSQAWEAMRQETEDFHVALEADLRIADMLRALRMIDSGVAIT
jgi:hypothetical protein